MLNPEKAADIARNVATKNLSSAAISRVFSQEFTDSEGEPSIRITIVLQPHFPERIKGDDALNTLIGIQAALREAGEERYPSVEYATEEELNESGSV